MTAQPSPRAGRSRLSRTGIRGARPIAAASAVLALAAAGCSGDDRLATAPPDSAAHPWVTVTQAERILGEVDAAVAAAASAGGVDAAGGRLTGPEADIRAFSYAAARSRGAAAPPPANPPRRERLVVPGGQGWPRWLITVGSAGGTAPVLRVVRTESARAPYGLWGELSMLPAATLPPMPAPARGAPLLAADAGGFVLTPAQALTRYADVLQRGDASPYAGSFAPDIFRSQIVARQQADAAQLASVATLTVQHQPITGSVMAMRTESGDALVIGAISQTYTLRVRRAGGRAVGSLRISDPDVQAVARQSAVTSGVTRTASEIVAMVVPRAGARPAPGASTPATPTATPPTATPTAMPPTASATGSPGTRTPSTGSPSTGTPTTGSATGGTPAERTPGAAVASGEPALTPSGTVTASPPATSSAPGAGDNAAQGMPRIAVIAGEKGTVRVTGS